jgi:hypothetical protein
VADLSSGFIDVIGECIERIASSGHKSDSKTFFGE